MGYTVELETSKHGKEIHVLRFDTSDELERFFIEELIGSETMKGRASKAIGATLLIWDR